MKSCDSGDAKLLEDHFHLLRILSEKIPLVQIFLDGCIIDVNQLLNSTVSQAKVCSSSRLSVPGCLLSHDLVKVWCDDCLPRRI
jgi:hypothetical protein